MVYWRSTTDVEDNDSTVKVLLLIFLDIKSGKVLGIKHRREADEKSYIIGSEEYL